MQAKTAEYHLPQTNEENQRLVHELQVHQIELEMQNVELRRARDELETALGMYTELYDFAPIGYLTINREGNISAVNFGGAKLLGIQRSRLLGRKFGLFVSHGLRSFFSEFLGKVFASRCKESCEVKLAANGNSPLFLQIEAVANGSGQECSIAIIDISDRRRAEDALTEKRLELEGFNRSLEERIAQAVDELRMKDRLLILQGRQAAMGEMINNIAHQWRQPLNTLGLVIQQVQLYHDLGDFNGEFLKEKTLMCMGLIQHMSLTIDDFRDFFRPDREKEVFEVNQIIERTLTLIIESFKNQHIGIELHMDAHPMISGYPNEYAQVLLNILMNSKDALAGHKPEDARIVLHSFEENGKAVITITDNGGGIAGGVIDRIFDPYFTTKETDKGTGIGLFMSKAIIEKNMGGRLTVRNTGGGAEFRIEV